VDLASDVRVRPTSFDILSQRMLELIASGGACETHTCVCGSESFCIKTALALTMRVCCPLICVGSVQHAHASTVRLLFKNSHLLDGVSSIPYALSRHLKSHIMAIVRKEHFVLSIGLAPPDDLVKVSAFVCVPGG
jgi:hypothetical protein